MMNISTVQKEHLTRRVFGDSIVDENDVSLCYSPSPRKPAAKAMEKEAPPQTGPFGNALKTQKNAPLAVIDTNNDQTKKSPRKEANTSTAIDQKPKPATSSKPTNKGGFLRNIRVQARSPLRRDLVKRTQDAIHKASISVNKSLNAAKKAKTKAMRVKFQQSKRAKQEWNEDASEAKTFLQQMQQSRHQVLSLERELSSHNSREKARRNLLNRLNQIEKIDKEAQFKSKVYREHQETLRQESERRRRQSTAARSKVRANHRRGQEELRLKQVAEEHAIHDERTAASHAIRDTRRALADQRRQSYVFRAGDARRIREIHADLEATRQQEEHTSYELKRAGAKDAEAFQRRQELARRESLALRNAKAHQQRQAASERHYEEMDRQHQGYELKWAGEKDAEEYQRQLALARRESLAFRNKEGRRQREQQEQLDGEALSNEHESYELKWAGEKDAEAYRRRLEEERRRSLAGRNREGKRIRGLEGQLQANALHEEHENYELKWAGEKDAEAYRRRLEEERRQSLADRNREGRRQRNEHEQQHSETLAKEHESYELKWAGEKDAERYQRQVAQERRNSLAGRNAEKVRHAQVMEELRCIAREKEAESLVLKWAGQEDAKDYAKELEEERRQYLKFRGRENVRRRQINDNLRAEELGRQHEDEALCSAAQKDVEAYRKQCAERDRTSLEYRRKEARKQRLEEESRRNEQQRWDAAAFQLDSMANADVQEYLKDCRRRRRMSLAVRAKEKRRHAEWERKNHQAQVRARSREVRDRLMDKHYIELAKQQERARIAMDAIKHANYSTNPFSGVL